MRRMDGTMMTKQKRPEILIYDNMNRMTGIPEQSKKVSLTDRKDTDAVMTAVAEQQLDSNSLLAAPAQHE